MTAGCQTQSPKATCLESYLHVLDTLAFTTSCLTQIGVQSLQNTKGIKEKTEVARTSTTHKLFSQCSSVEHLGCFLFAAAVNKTTPNSLGNQFLTHTAPSKHKERPAGSSG